jgi:tripartite-type tricarboxylate transporter receptor subunit TctC
MCGFNKPFIGFIVIASLIMAFGLPAVAAEYPTKPISYVIPFPAGGSTDITSRALANAAKKYLGQPVICENKPGGGGAVGPSLVVPKPPDGYTIGTITPSVPNAFHMGKLNFHPLEDVTYIMRWCGNLYGIVVRADSPWKTIQELLQFSKQNPQKVVYGSPGVGSSTHLAAEELAMAAGIQWTHMPTKGVAEDNVALLSGYVDFISDAAGWVPLVDAGKFRLLATWGNERSAHYPQVPTVKETGYNVVALGPMGVFGPKGLPAPIVNKLHQAFKKAMDDPEFIETMKKLDMPLLYLGPEDYERFVRQDFENIGKLVQKLGLQKK